MGAKGPCAKWAGLAGFPGTNTEEGALVHVLPHTHASRQSSTGIPFTIRKALADESDRLFPLHVYTRC